MNDFSWVPEGFVWRLSVTENGSAWPDAIAPDGQVHDRERVDYLDKHLAACGRRYADVIRQTVAARA